MGNPKSRQNYEFLNITSQPGFLSRGQNTSATTTTAKSSITRLKLFISGIALFEKKDRCNSGKIIDRVLQFKAC